MIATSLYNLLKVLEDELLTPNDAEKDILSLQVIQDSRQANERSVFVAIDGPSINGHKFIPEVIKKGAPVIIGEDPELETSSNSPVYMRVKNSKVAFAKLCLAYYSKSLQSLTLWGITGTNGKTTTAELVYQICKNLQIPCGKIGTLGAFYHEKFIPLNNTTPDIHTLCELLHEMAQNNVKHVIMEVSSHALAQLRVYGLPFKASLFTNLTHEHLDYHQDMETYFNEKKKLFRKDIFPGSYSLINVDDPFGKRLSGSLDINSPVIPLSIDSDLSKNNEYFCQVEQDNSNLEGVSFLLRYKLPNDQAGKLEVTSPLFGKHNIYNLSTACALLLLQSIDKAKLSSSLEGIDSVPGRLEKVSTTKDDITVFVDYAHTSHALRNVLTALKHHCTNITCLFGCGGDRDQVKRPLMAKEAAHFSNKVIVTSDNPRGEDPKKIIDEIIIGFPDEEEVNYLVEQDRLQAINLAISAAVPHETILIAGKGHEDYQIVKGKTLPFDDRIEAKKALINRQKQVKKT